MTLYQFYPISNTENPVPADADFSMIDDPKGQPDENATRALLRVGQVGVRRRYGLTVRPMQSIQSVELVIRQRTQSPLVTCVEVEAGIYDTGSATEFKNHDVRPKREPTWREYKYLMLTNPITAVAWVPADFGNIQVFMRSAGTGTCPAFVTQLFLDVDGVAGAGEVDDGERMGLGRGASSGILQLFRRPLPVVELELPLYYFNIPVLRWLNLSHFAGPTPDAIGWDPTSDVPWRRSRIFVLSKEVMPGTQVVRIRGFMDRNVVLRLWDVLVSEESPKPDISAGMARFHPAGRKFMRDTSTYVENAEAEAQGTMNIALLGPDFDKHAAGGTWFERLRHNWIKRGTFISGTTGLTLTGTGVNGSAIAAETSELIFDVDITLNGLRFTAGTVIADVYAAWPVTEELHANSIVSLLFYHISDSPLGVPMGRLSWSLQRGVDSQYFTASGETWGASVAWNNLTITEENLREVVRDINIGTSPTTLTLRVGITSTGIASQQNILHHVQLTEGRNPGTIIATDAAIDRVAADELRFASLHGREQAWNPEHGHVFAQYIADFNSADLATGEERVIAEVLYENRTPWIDTVAGSEVDEFSVRWVDDDHYHRLSYVKGTGWRFRHRLNATNTDAVLAGTVVANQLYNCAGTWTGSQGEWNRAPYTQSVVIDGVHGTDAVAAGSHAPIPSRALVTVGASQRWRPTDLANPWIWVEGDRGVYKQGSIQDLGAGHGLYDDEEIVLWEDQTDNDNFLSGSGAPRIQLEELNGLDAIHFSASESAFFAVPGPFSSTSHWFYLVNFENVTDGKFLLGSTTGALQGALRTSASKLQILGAGATWLDLINPIEAGQWMILEVIQYAGSCQGMKNGLHGGARQTLTAAYQTGALQLGADAGANTKQMTVYAMLVYDRVLRMDEARLPLTYLSSKTAVSVLGVSHRPVFHHADGRIKHFRVGDVVLHDEEIADLP